MPAIRGLEDHLRTIQIVDQRPLDELSGVTVGIDVFPWLRSNLRCEVLQPQLGGLPITLEKQIHEQLFEFHKWKINPVFVFNGLKYSQKTRAPFSSSRSRKYAAKRKKAWKLMENHDVQKAIDIFSQVSGLISTSIQDDLFRIFSRWNVMISQKNKLLHAQYQRAKAAANYYECIEWMRAPYYAASQLAYFMEQGKVDIVFGVCDLLMFGAEKVIFNIDFNSASYEVVNLHQVLVALNIKENPYNLIDASLLSGFDGCRTFEPMCMPLSKTDGPKKHTRRNFKYTNALNEVLKKGSGLTVIQEYLYKFIDYQSVTPQSSNIKTHSKVVSKMNKMPFSQIQEYKDQGSLESPKYSQYLEIYLEVRKNVCNATILSSDDERKTFRPFKWMKDDTKETEQKEVENLTDQNIPLNVYKLLSVGILSTVLPSAILTGHLIDTTPLIDSNEVERSMNSLLPLRQKVLNIFQHGFGTSNSISLQRWYQPNRIKELEYDIDGANQWVNQFKAALNIIFNDDSLQNESPTLITPLKMLLDRKITFVPITAEKLENFKLPQINHISQILTAAYCGTLITLNYIRDNCALSNVAKSLAKINKFEFETVLAIEMLKKEDLTEKILTLIDENSKIFQIDTLSSAKYRNSEINHKIIAKRRTLRLLTRICALLPMRPFIDGQNDWRSKLSHSLAAFNHVTTTHHRGIKNCIESTITWLYCNIEEQGVKNNILTSERFLQTLALSLKQLPPEPCSGMGVLIQEFVINFSYIDWNSVNKDFSAREIMFYKLGLVKEQLKMLKEAYPVFSKLNLAVQCCMQFFYQMCTLVKELGDAKILMNSVVIQFEDAYDFLRELGIWDAIYFMDIHSDDRMNKCTFGFIRESVNAYHYMPWPSAISNLICCFVKWGI